MKTAELQTLFFKETGTECVNSQGEFDIDYVAWLEKRVLDVPVQSPSEGTRVTPTDLELEKDLIELSIKCYSDIDNIEFNKKDLIAYINEKTEVLRTKLGNAEMLLDCDKNMPSPVSTNTVTDEAIKQRLEGFYIQMQISESQVEDKSIYKTFTNELRSLFSHVSCNKVAEPDGYLDENDKFLYPDQANGIENLQSVYFSPVLETKVKDRFEHKIEELIASVDGNFIPQKLKELLSEYRKLNKDNKTDREKLISFLMDIDECHGMHVREEAEKCVDEYLNKTEGGKA